MPRPLTFACEGSLLAGTLHPAAGTTGAVIVTGGVQTRAGAHRGFFDLASRLATAGIPALRYDRRGLGDSDGVDPGFRDSAADIAAAVVALRQAEPAIARVVGFGLCDGAAALALHAGAGLDGLILANPWTLDSDFAPPIAGRAAVLAHYRARLLDPSFWRRLIAGGIDLGKVARGLRKLNVAEPMTDTGRAMAASLASFGGPALILLSGRDNAAATFAAAWQSRPFAAARGRADIQTVKLPGADHSFSRASDAEAMATECIEWLKGLGSSGRT